MRILTLEVPEYAVYGPSPTQHYLSIGLLHRFSASYESGQGVSHTGFILLENKHELEGAPVAPVTLLG
jgi:hypothetical protein